jgi:ubiquinone/menaquinone biosynthesis C-methylase UbiE
MDPDDRSARVAAVFDRAAETYDAVGVPWFTPIAQRLVAELAPAAGERALDIGCGRGAALFPLAEGVTSTGSVTGIDLAPGMVAATRRDVEARGLQHVELHVMDARHPDLPKASYDVIASSLVLFFLPDPAAALTAWRELLAPGGRLGISTFADRDHRWVALDAVFRPYLPPALLDARTSGEKGPFESDEGVEELLRSAGYDNVRTTSMDLSVTFTGIDQWHEWSWAHGQRDFLDSVIDAVRPSVLDAAAAALEGSRDEQGRLALSQRIRFTLAGP